MKNRYIYVLSVLGASLTSVQAQVTNVNVEATNTGKNIITWSFGENQSPVDIYWSTSPRNVDNRATLLASGITGTSYVCFPPDAEVQAMHTPQTNKRVYYIVKPKDGASIVSATRKIDRFYNVTKMADFKPINNFRELGGYVNKDNRQVKWGKFYRSNELGNLDAKEIRFVKHLNIGTIFDLRKASEVEAAPDVYVGAEMVYFENPNPTKNVTVKSPEKRLKIWKGMTNENVFDYMVQSNKKYATDYIPVYRKMFETLISEKPGEPILVHCAGGKDRTGAISAIFLSALDIPRETIIDDYLLTGVYRQVEDDTELNYVKEINNLTDEEVETIAPAWRVYPEYLQKFFDTIDEKYGSMDQYLEKECGLTPQMKVMLKDLYLD